MHLPLPSGAWVYKRVAGTNPGAGVELGTGGQGVDSPATSKWWILLSVSVSLVQGLTQTPQPILIIDDGANTLYECAGSSAAQAVSTTCQYTWAPTLPLSAQLGATTNVHATAPLPYPLFLLPGFRIRTVTLGIGANTDYGAPSYFVAELG
jgi:hypothetical protein